MAYCTRLSYFCQPQDKFLKPLRHRDPSGQRLLFAKTQNPGDPENIMFNQIEISKTESIRRNTADTCHLLGLVAWILG